MSDALTGDRAWIREVMERYEGRLVRYALRYTGDLDSARDVVQDAFLRLCQADRAKVEGTVAAWLYTVCRHRALDVRRKERRMDVLEDPDGGRLIDPEPSPSATAEARAAHGEVLAVLATLPARQQEVVLLRFQEGLAYREISDVTGLSVTNVGFLLHTALKTVRQRLAGRPDAGQPEGSAA